MQMTPKTLAEMAHELWQTRKHLKYDPVSLDEIAKGEFEAGYLAGARAALKLPEVSGLLPFTEHTNNCRYWVEPKCNCGLVAALAAFDRLTGEVGECAKEKDGGMKRAGIHSDGYCAVCGSESCGGACRVDDSPEPPTAVSFGLNEALNRQPKPRERLVEFSGNVVIQLKERIAELEAQLAEARKIKRAVQEKARANDDGGMAYHVAIERIERLQRALTYAKSALPSYAGWDGVEQLQARREIERLERGE